MTVTSLTDSLLLPETDEQRALRDGVSSLAASFGREYFQKAASTGGFPHEMWRALGEAGYLGVHISEANGGGGGGLVDLAIVIEECAAHGCPMQMIVISPSIAGSIFDRHASPELQAKWLPGIASGDLKVCFAITEPDAGTNTHRISTTASPRPGGGWILKGSKYWTSGIDECDAVLVVARDAQMSTPERSALSLFVIPSDAPGLSYSEIDSALRAPERQFVTFYDDVEIEPEWLVGEQGKGLEQVFAGLNPERVAAAALATGLGMYAIGRASTYANQRVVWKVPIGAHQGLAHPLAKAYIDVQLARLMNFRAAAMFDAGLDSGEAANMAKLAAADASLLALDQAMQVHGGNGLSNEYGLSDLWFTARMLKTAPVSREMVLNYVAQHSLGLPKSY